MTDIGVARLGWAFTLGTATFFAPCAFPLLPGYVAYYLGTSETDSAGGSRATRLGRAAGVGLLVSLGFALVYGALGLLLAAVGPRIVENIAALELVVGLALIVVGGVMATGRFQVATLHVPLPERRRSAAGYVLFGVVYAAAAAGCTAPLFLGVSFEAVTTGPVATVATLGAYAAGMSVLMVGVTTATALGRDTLLRRLSGATGRISRVAGAVVVLAGLVQLYYFLVVFDGLATLGLA
ncbi:cytochrome C biogenesis protein [Halorientalis sp. IM1011]|uniref:cytochrome c biogenesis CcdA family protein n=1 Tax=Halorientalis sp. IM1011 TaxID=1932360 RepID=UPI00097CC1CD|nr:cytochrome c biogenesis protein CcdA [Halorientalis sp. IM1011]AQL41354.1 cytochrome C biogenesis protein [Halorientalis sp. IM1011]